eukprot:8197731-Pyramimonas_sp.AAC.1
MRTSRLGRRFGFAISRAAWSATPFVAEHFWCESHLQGLLDVPRNQHLRRELMDILIMRAGR